MEAMGRPHWLNPRRGFGGELTGNRLPSWADALLSNSHIPEPAAMRLSRSWASRPIMREPAPPRKEIIVVPTAGVRIDDDETPGMLRKRRRLTIPKVLGSNDHLRTAEIEKWTQFLLIAGEEHSGLAKQLTSETNEVDKAATINMTFAEGAPGTFRRHACAMGIYIRWAKSMQLPIFQFTEQRTFRYVVDCVQAKAPPSRAQGFIQAANFATERFMLFSGKTALNSARISGAVTSSFDHKKEVVEAVPLTVAAVKLLEQILMDTSRPLGERHMAGFFLFCTFTRLRVGDAVRISQEPSWDPEDPDEHSGFGFIYTKSIKTKTTQHRRARRDRRSVQMVTHSWGLNSAN